MRFIALAIAFVVAFVITAACNSCSSAQKAEERAVLICLGSEEAQLAAAVSAHDYGAITNDLLACARAAAAAKKAAAAAAESGSAGSAAH